MRAVNLIPADARGRGRNRGSSTGMQVPVYVLLGLLAAAVALVTVYVLTNNSIVTRKATLNNLKTQVTQEQAAVARLGEFTKFSQLAQTRIGTVRSIAAARFDWHNALSDLAKVVPANTTLQSVTGTVVPGASAGGGGGAGTGGLRTAITAPAFELSGCTHSQDDVARLISQLRLINGVTRVAFSNSQESSTASSSGSGDSQGCGANAPTFSLVVFFQPVPNAGPTGVTSVAGTAGAAGTSGTPGASSTTGSPSTPGATSTTGTTSTTSTTSTTGGPE